MPNMGFAAATSLFKTMKFEQPLVVSVAGFLIDDYVLGMKTFGSLPNVAAVELNFGCPNTQSEHNDIISFNPPVVRAIFEQIVTNAATKQLWLKFSPYSNPAELKRMALLVNEYARKLPLAVITCNTFPNAYAGVGKIDTNDGMARKGRRTVTMQKGHYAVAETLLYGNHRAEPLHAGETRFGWYQVF